MYVLLVPIQKSMKANFFSKHTMPIKVNQPEEYKLKQCEFTDSVFAKYWFCELANGTKRREKNETNNVNKFLRKLYLF